MHTALHLTGLSRGVLYTTYSIKYYYWYVPIVYVHATSVLMLLQTSVKCPEGGCFGLCDTLATESRALGLWLGVFGV